MKIKGVVEIIKEIRYLRSIIKKYGDSLARGKYYLFDSFRALSLNSLESKAAADAYFGRAKSTNRKRQVAKVLNKYGFFCNRSKASTSEYEALYSANNFDKKREVKLFSFKNKKILTLCTSKEEFEKQILNYNVLKYAYNMPRVEAQSKYPDSYEISMVCLEALPGDKEALNNIVDSTLAFNPDSSKLSRVRVEELLDFTYGDVGIQDSLKSISSKISGDFLKTEIPLCLQHGDLSKDNLIYGESDGKTSFWWIDWEHIENRPFFYDYFFYITNSAVYFDKKALCCYMSGDCDSMLVEFFSHFGLQYKKESKVDYLLVFFTVFLKERVCAFERKTALEMYCRFINEEILKRDNLDEFNSFEEQRG